MTVGKDYCFTNLVIHSVFYNSGFEEVMIKVFMKLVQLKRYVTVNVLFLFVWVYK